MKSGDNFRNLIISLMILIVAGIVAATSIFGWFTANEKPKTGGIVSQVTGGLEVTLKINGEEYTGGGFEIANILPGDEFLFQFDAVSERTISVNIVLQGIEGEFETSVGVYENMSDALAIKYPHDSLVYTRISALQDGIAASGILLESGIPATVKFALVFPVEAPEGKDINIYQNRSLKFSRIVFVGVN